MVLLLAALGCAQALPPGSTQQPGVAAAQGAKPTAVAITREPSHHKIIENDRVRVFKVEVAPHAATMLHQHDRDYLFVTLGDSEVSNEVAGKPAVKLQLKDGETHFTKGGFAHVARNLSGQPFRNVTIELAQPAQGKVTVCDPSKEICDEQRGQPCVVAGVILCATKQTLIQAENFSVAQTMIPSGLTGATQDHPTAYLLVAISDLDLRSKSPRGSKRSIHQRAGDVEWMQPGTAETVTNAGKGMARFITLEFK